MSRSKLSGLAQDLYQLACAEETTLLRLTQIREQAKDIEQELMSLALAKGYEGLIEVKDLVLDFGRVDVVVYTKDQYEKLDK